MIVVTPTPAESFALSVRGKLGSLAAEGRAVTLFQGACPECFGFPDRGGSHAQYCPAKTGKR